MIKINKKTLEPREELDYKYPFFFMLFANIFACIHIAREETRIIRKTRVIHTIDTMIVERKDVALNDSSICAELVKLGCVLPNVAVAQFRIETGNYTSAICRENKNLAGIRNSVSKLSTGKNRGHNTYRTYRDCLKDYVRVQNKYLKNIDGRYAEAKGYVNLIKSMNK